MKTIGIADARNNLSRHLDYVRRGGRIRILDRDLPVADLIPVSDEPSRSSGDPLLRDLERRGIVRRGKGGPIPKDLLKAGPSDRRGRVLKSLLGERRKGR
jgi:antitoxin (DNA-binding transcriptional repressor) of toxin-antitoxin stability system